MNRNCILALLLAGSFAFAGCNDSPVSTPEGGDDNPLGANGAAIRVMLTDAPSDYIESAVVTITEVYLVSSPDDSSEDEEAPALAGDENDTRVVLHSQDDEPLVYDLLTLRNDIEAFLGEIPVDAGLTFHQLRLVVDDADVTLVAGYEFDDGATTQNLKTPSAHASGIKVKLDEPVVAEEGMVTIVTVDFDVDQNFKFQGNPETPAGIKGVLFTPVLQEKKRTQEVMDEE
jgi:hypothetical protein